MSLDNRGSDHDEEYFIVFQEAESKHWVQRFLKQGFSHCWAYKRSPGGQFWIVIDPMQSHLHIDLIDIDTKLHELHKDATILRISNRIDVSRERGHLCRFTCVEVVKCLLGIKSPLAFTPYQLYKRLQYGRFI
jgi:hypothetical protein